MAAQTTNVTCMLHQNRHVRQDPWQLMMISLILTEKPITSVYLLRGPFDIMTKKQRQITFLALGFLLWSTSVLSNVICYNPDGSRANDDVPCTSDATTFCCNKGDVCMSNGLCYLQGKRGFVLSRASCTDRSWEACGSFTYCSEPFP